MNAFRIVCKGHWWCVQERGRRGWATVDRFYTEAEATEARDALVLNDCIDAALLTEGVGEPALRKVLEVTA